MGFKTDFTNKAYLVKVMTNGGGLKKLSTSFMDDALGNKPRLS